MKPRLLDLFCGAGGASVGYHRAGFEVAGIDIMMMRRYPYKFIRGDALDWMDAWLDARPFRIDAIHASPPCQRYTTLALGNQNHQDWPDLVAPVRERLEASGLPYVIENVETAPLLNPIILCGTMFPGLRVLRHRAFESNVSLVEPEHPRHPKVFTYDKRKHQYGTLDQDTAFVQVTGGGNCTVANKKKAMGINWMTGLELNEAIPPAYTHYIGAQLIGAL